jgi:type I restriction enzyme S subunit
MAVISKGLFSDAVVADRLDAEFFDPLDLILVKKMSEAGAKTLGDICHVFNGKTPTEYVDGGEIRIVRSGDLVSPLIYPGCADNFLTAQKSSKIVPLIAGDVLISSIGMGSIGKISLVMDASNFATVSEVTILRSKGYPPEVLFAYLTTDQGQRQINRQITGATGQQHLLKSKVQTILVPAAPKSAISEKIKESCARAWELEVAARAQHGKSHAIFAEAVGL